MAKPPSPLDFTVSLTFTEKVPLATRKEIIEDAAAGIKESLEYNGHSGLLEHATVECSTTSQTIEISDHG